MFAFLIQSYIHFSKWTRIEFVEIRCSKQNVDSWVLYIFSVISYALKRVLFLFPLTTGAVKCQFWRTFICHRRKIDHFPSNIVYQHCMCSYLFHRIIILHGRYSKQQDLDYWFVIWDYVFSACKKLNKEYTWIEVGFSMWLWGRLA